MSESRRNSQSLASAYPLRDLFDAAVRGHTIRLTCWKCGHVRTLHAHALWWRFHQRGWRARFRDVAARCRCLRCQNERQVIIRNPKLELVHEPVTDQSLPLPPLHEWKKEVQRRR